MSRIKLNVGGKHFETTRETLELSSYFDNWEESKEDELFIDRDGEIFTHVLRLLRYPEYPYPNEYVYELAFYQLEAKNIRPSLVDIAQELKSIEAKQDLRLED